MSGSSVPEAARAAIPERPEGPEVAERLAISRQLNPDATEYEVGWHAGYVTARAQAAKVIAEYDADNEAIAAANEGLAADREAAWAEVDALVAAAVAEERATTGRRIEAVDRWIVEAAIGVAGCDDDQRTDVAHPHRRGAEPGQPRPARPRIRHCPGCAGVSWGGRMNGWPSMIICWAVGHDWYKGRSVGRICVRCWHYEAPPVPGEES